MIQTLDQLVREIKRNEMDYKETHHRREREDLISEYLEMTFCGDKNDLPLIQTLISEYTKQVLKV